MEHNRVIYERPYDAKIEYLKSAPVGFCYIDTGIPISSNISFYAVAQYSQGGPRPLFGAYDSTDNSKRLALIMSSEFRFGSNSVRIESSAPVLTYDTTENPNILHIGNNVYSTPTATFSSNYTLYLFGMNRDGNLSGQGSGGMVIYQFKIYDNTTLVRDFIPVRVGSVGYLYDKVSKKLFANKGTGNFILGQDISNTVPNIRRVFRFANKRFVMPMPYDSRVEYLEVGNTSNCYIDTGILSSNSISIVTQIQVLDNYAGFLFEGGNSSANAELGFLLKGNGSEVSFRYGNKMVSSNRITFPSEPFIISSLDNPRTLVVNGTKFSADANTFSSQNSIYLFGQHRNNISSGTAKNSRVYYFKMYNSGTLVRDFIPVRRGNVGYLYDKVSGKLFGNSGTGQFILGNDIND